MITSTFHNTISHVHLSIPTLIDSNDNLLLCIGLESETDWLNIYLNQLRIPLIDSLRNFYLNKCLNTLTPFQWIWSETSCLTHMCIYFSVFFPIFSFFDFHQPYKRFFFFFHTFRCCDSCNLFMWCVPKETKLLQWMLSFSRNNANVSKCCFVWPNT